MFNLSKKTKIASLVLASTVFLAACGADGNGGQDSNTLFFLPINDTGAYWSVMLAGARAEAEALGFELEHRIAPSINPQRNEMQIGAVREAVAQNAAGLSIAPIDPDMLDRVVQEAVDAGIPVVTFDSDVATAANRVSYVGTDNFDAGRILGMRAAQHLIETGVSEGSLQIVMTWLTQTTMILRQAGIVDGFNEVMGDNASNFRFLEPIEDQAQSTVSMQQLEARIVANPDLVAVFSLGAEGPTTGVMEALRSQGKGGIIPHFGFDFTPTWLNGIEEGLVFGIVNQNAYEIGRTVIRTKVDVIQGREVPATIPIDATWVYAADIEEHGRLIQERMGE